MLSGPPSAVDLVVGLGGETAGVTGFLDHVDLYLDQFGSPPANLNVEIQTTVNGAPSGVVIGRGTVSPSSVPAAGRPTWVSVPLRLVFRRFVLPPIFAVSGVPSVAGQQYAIVVSSLESNCGGGGLEGSGCWYHWFNNSDVYAGGSAAFEGSSATSWSVNSSSGVVPPPTRRDPRRPATN